MKALLFTCVLVPWLAAASAGRLEQDSQLIAGSLAGSERNGYFVDRWKLRRARRALPVADEPGDAPVGQGGDASGFKRKSYRELRRFEMQDAHRSVVNNSLHSEEGLMFVLCLCVTDLPTCLLCVCLTGSVYCEEVSPDVTSVPSLPKETAYLYARFNKIKKIRTKDFADIVTLRRIDLTGNMISEIEDGAFSNLPLLEELSLAENKLAKLPMLPAKLKYFNANNNLLKTRGVKANAFKKLTTLMNLYLADNQLEAVPHIPDSVRILHLQNNNITEVNVDTFCRSNDTYYLRPSLSEVRMDGNPVVLSKYPDSFTCMKVLPIGQYR
uniref:Mimecan n=1 Tax=Gasterosteus aculeatus aculeatus TaxID=481459 RepID=A0AAQ4QGM2_GASAC